MRYRLAFLVALVILNSLSSGCATVPAGERQPSDAMGLIRFPESWRSGRGAVNDMPQFVIRKSNGELIFTVKQGFDPKVYGSDVYDFPVRDTDYDYYSDNHFAVTLDGKFGIRKVGDSEWTSAVKPVHSYRFIYSDENPLVTDAGVSYGNRLYPKTGNSWATKAALVSPGARWIAVFSFTSPDKPRPALIPGFGGNGPAHGDLFIDVYDTASGDKILARRASFGNDGAGVSPSLLIGMAVWIEDRYLIVPINSSLQSCFLITLPDK